MPPHWPEVLSMLTVGGLYATLPASVVGGGPRWLLLAVVVMLLPTIIAHLRGDHALNQVLGHILNGVVTAAMIGTLALLIHRRYTLNAMVTAMPRPINYLHIPVPMSRDDDAYFQTLHGLKLPAGTALYMGLIHASDGVAGARRRMATADCHSPVSCGIATECGMARQRTPALVKKLLELHAELAREE